ncbi:glycosyltransferase family 4 protein [Bacillus kexueae]|uniref:glycosyltransferase family 4 protein n=1 Tax=Aeribacillus kexueae TaxID=2078952 RepID=UPI001FB021AB|nr:glycosyltransferase family 4 protein [Bacillus kexueae]
MKILFMFTIPSGGMETLNRQRHLALKSVGIESHFLYRFEGSGIQNQLDAPIFVSNTESDWNTIITKNHYDYIIVSYDLILLKAVSQSGFNGKIIYDNQGIGKRKDYINHYIKNQAYPFIESYADAIMCPKTPHLMEAFNSFFPHKKKYFIHNGIDTNSFQYINTTKHPNLVIGWVGRIEENKNWKDFLEIGRELLKEYPDLELWIFEDASLSHESQRKVFNDYVNELSLQSNIKQFQSVPHEDMAKYYSVIGDSGGLICSTSRVEGFGYAVIEAMLCHCPVLATDSDGVRNFITHNKTGKFYSIHHIAEAVSEAKDLIENKKIRHYITKNAKDRIVESFSIEKYAEQLLSMIHDLSRN